MTHGCVEVVRENRVKWEPVADHWDLAHLGTASHTFENDILHDTGNDIHMELFSKPDNGR